MARAPGKLDHWRKFFRTSNSDIFDVIEQAIIVAAVDFQQEFLNQRDRIVEKFYTAVLPRCSGCGGAGSEVEDGDRSEKRNVIEKEKKFDSSDDGDEELRRIVSNYSYDEAEALTEEIEEENQMVGEVLRIKDVLVNQRDTSESVLFESLRRLQLMELSVEVLKATEIGRAVNLLRKSNSKQIRHLVRILIEGWKVLVDEWVCSTASVEDNTPNSVNPPSDDEEEGLPSPPLDEGALFATQTTSIELSEFFDGMDDDGNLRNNGDFDKKWENGRRLPEKHEPVRKQPPAQQAGVVRNKTEMRRQEPRELAAREDRRGQDIRHSAVVEEKELMRRKEPNMRQTKPSEPFFGRTKTEVMSKQSMPVITDAGPGTPPLLTGVQKNVGMVKSKHQQSVPLFHGKPPRVPQDKLKNSVEASVNDRLEIAKRKLQEGYQQAENAKKQRTIQVMELQDIPKQPQNRLPIMKSHNKFKSWAKIGTSFVNFL